MHITFKYKKKEEKEKMLERSQRKRKFPYRDRELRITVNFVSQKSYKQQ